jgi:uncharacterized protein YciI
MGPLESSPAEPTRHYYLLIYEVPENYAEARAAYRMEHLELARRFEATGLLLGGAVGDPIEQAVLLFRSPGPEVAQEFASLDPYVRHGVVRAWKVVRWNVAAGQWLPRTDGAAGR